MSDQRARKLRFLSFLEECIRAQQPKPELDYLDLFIEITEEYEALRKALDGITKNVLATIGG